MKKIVLTIMFAVLIIGTSPIAYADEDHDAGYEWGKEHDIRDVNYISDNSQSFNEGVRAYSEDVEEKEAECWHKGAVNADVVPNDSD